MRERRDAAAPSRGRAIVAEAVPYALTATAVLLAWQIAIQPFVQRAPVEAAIRIAPTSTLALRRAAEVELAAGRLANAGALARDALGRSPFDVRSLRIVGLVEAREGRIDQADELLTLAGNWSLRDDPTHAWLVEHRLGRGDYASSFAHADTLVRRREDIRPSVFRLFTLAAERDGQRSLPVLTSLLAARPPWRQPFLESLHETNEGLQVAANLAVLLQSSEAPLTNAELGELYLSLLRRNPLAVRAVQMRLNRPRTADLIANGAFEEPGIPAPFQWRLAQSHGLFAEIVNDDLKPGDRALRVEYDGYAGGQLVEQLTFLAPGAYRFAGETKSESGNPAGRLTWTITCQPGGAGIGESETGATAPNRWEAWSIRLVVPAGCPTQLFQLKAPSADSRTSNVAWFDRITLTPEATGGR